MIEFHEDYIEDIPDHVNDRDGHISLFLMGMAILLLLLLILAVVQAM